MANPTRWTKRPQGSNWGDFGAEDQCGRLNLLTPEKILQGIAEVREGLAFNLSLPLDVPGGNVLNPRRHPPVLRPTLRNNKPNLNYALGDDDPNITDIVSDDLVIMHTQYSTQWDSLAHVGSQFDVDGNGTLSAVYYNGYRAGIDVIGPATGDAAGVPASAAMAQGSTSAAHALGIEKMAERCVQGRAVMIDLHAHLGNQRVAVDFALLSEILQKDQITVEVGDMVCLHTGFAELLLSMNKQPDEHVLARSCAVLEGRDPRLLEWISDSGLSVLIADNYAVEGHPASHQAGLCASLPLHEHCLFKLGIHLGELWHLTPLANWLRAHGRHRFFLTAPPLRLPGAVGSPVAPVGTV